MKLTTPNGFIIEGAYEDVMKAYERLTSKSQSQDEDLNKKISELQEQRILWGKQSQ